MEFRVALILIGEGWVLAMYVMLVFVLIDLRRRRAWSRPRLFFLALFSAYLFQVLQVTLFPIPVDRVFDPDLSEASLRAWVELRPFIISFHPSIIWSQTVPNVVLGVPFGVLAWFVLNRPTFRTVLLAGLATFLLIEVLQFVIALSLVGYPYRVSDISDWILNGFGVLIGAGAFLVLSLLWRSLDRGGPSGDLIEYFRSVVNGSHGARPSNGQETPL